VPEPGTPLWQRLRTRPRLVAGDVAAARLADLDAAADASVAAVLVRPRVRDLLAGVADHSPYLWHLILADPPRFARVMEDDPAVRLEAILAQIATAPAEEAEGELMRRLRRLKQEVALLVALADLGGAWRLEDVVQALSRAADGLIAAALAHLLRRAAASRKLALPDADDPQRGCGVVVLGLGKLGGCELNYSSDVDLMIVFDPASPAIIKRDEAQTLFVRMVRDLVRLLQQRTADGYVMRVDLRLRPRPRLQRRRHRDQRRLSLLRGARPELGTARR